MTNDPTRTAVPGGTNDPEYEPPTYYWRTSYDEESWENADGSFITESYPYCEIREKPNRDSEIGSHSIARCDSEGWAQRIVDALNHAPVPLPGVAASARAAVARREGTQ